MNPLVRLTSKNHRAKSEARAALATATAPLFLTLGLGLVYGLEFLLSYVGTEATQKGRIDSG